MYYPKICKTIKYIKYKNTSCGNHLNNEEKTKKFSYKGIGLSFKEIERRLNVILYFIKNPFKH